MISSKITAGDLAKVAGVTRHKLRSLMRELPGFSEPAERARLAKEYTRQDMAVLVICWELESQYGLKREVVGRLAPAIRGACSGPKKLANGAHLVIMPMKDSVKYLDKPQKVYDGLIIPLDALVERIDRYLAQDPNFEGSQRILNLGPAVVAQPSNSPDLSAESVLSRSHSKRGSR